MFTPIQSFILCCDNCNESYENGNGFGIFADKDAAKDDAVDDGWYDDGDKHYCPKCFTIDDDDKLIVKRNKNS